MGNMLHVKNVQAVETYGGAVVVAAYEDGKIQFTIGFDEDMKLVQFLIQ